MVDPIINYIPAQAVSDRISSNIPQRNMPRYKFECETDTPEVQSLRKKLKQYQAYADRRDKEISELKSRYNRKSGCEEKLIRELREWKARVSRRDRELDYWKSRCEKLESQLRHGRRYH
jgi:predicted RNase H-like nuclease (RuvC/YqgF family)